MSLCSKNRIIVLYLFVLFDLLFPQKIDLNEQDIYIRKGFDDQWINSLPAENDDWLLVHGKSGSRPLVIRRLGFDNLPQHTFLSPQTFPAESFTFITSFEIEKRSATQQTPLSVYWRGAGYGWEVFINGVSISSQFHQNSAGEFLPRRGHQIVMQIPPKLIKAGKNILAYHIKGDPTYYGTGFYYGKPYYIAPTETFLPLKIKLFSISHFAVYVVLGLVWAYLFIRQSKYILYVYFAILSFVFALYNFVRAFVEINSGVFSFISFHLEYFCIFAIAAMFALTVTTLLKNKITAITFIYSSICGVFAFIALWAEPNFLFDLLRMWQFTLPLMSAYMFYLSIAGYAYNKQATQQKAASQNTWVSMPKGESMMIVISVSLVLLTTLADALDSIVFRLAINSNRFGFLSFMILVFGVLFNRFIKAGKHMEKWNEILDQEVKNRTHELTATKNDIEAILINSGEGIAKFSVDLKLESYNKAYKDLFGYSDEELRSMSIGDFYLPEDLKKLKEHRRNVLANGFERFQTRAICKNGKTIYLAVTGTSMKDSAGEPCGIVVNMKDITKEVLAEKQLRDSKEHLEAIFKVLPDLFFRIDEYGVYLEHYGPEKLLYNRNKLITGKKIQDILPADVASQTMEAIKSCLQNNVQQTIDYALEIDEELLCFEAVILPFRQGEVVAGVRNITERQHLLNRQKELIDKLNHQQENLRRLSRDEAKIQEEERAHISRILHDEIGQAMTAISLNLEGIRTGHENVETLKAQILGCQELLEETSNKIHSISGELRPPGLDYLGLLAVMRAHAHKQFSGSGLAVEISGDEGVERFSPEIKTVLYRIYLEGINNTVKHSNATLSKVTFQKENGIIRYTISDNGVGFDPKQIHAHSDGLGLLGMEERIRSLGGTMEVHSRKGAGTAILIEIPFDENLYIERKND